MESPSRRLAAECSFARNVVMAAKVLIHESDGSASASAACVIAFTLMCAEALMVNSPLGCPN
jgi:hypothetical protein